MVLDAIIIGAGQAGLAAAYHAQQAGMTFTMLEASEQVGGSWPAYYASLRLFSPARFSSLPGLPFPGDGEHYPSRDDVTDYLRRYAQHFKFPIHTSKQVIHITQAQADFTITVQDGTTYTASNIIAATGSFHRPYIPTIPGQQRFNGTILHSATYQEPSTFQDQRVIVVGGGNSAVQIATELAQIANVSLATRHPLRFQAQQVYGKDIHWWWWLTGFDRFPLSQRLGAAIQRTSVGMILDPGIYQRAIDQGRPEQRSMFKAFTPRGVIWQGDQQEEIDSVIFATGYRPNLDYLTTLGALDAQGQPLQRAGISTVVPGLAYVGLEQQRTFASATLRGVGSDAAYVVKALKQRLQRTQRCCSIFPQRAF